METGAPVDKSFRFAVGYGQLACTFHDRISDSRFDEYLVTLVDGQLPTAKRTCPQVLGQLAGQVHTLVLDAVGIAVEGARALPGWPAAHSFHSSADLFERRLENDYPELPGPCQHERELRVPDWHGFIGAAFGRIWP